MGSSRAAAEPLFISHGMPIHAYGYKESEGKIS
jgi:hypothetical protein